MRPSAVAGSYRYNSVGQGRHSSRDIAPVGRIPANNSQNRNRERIGNYELVLVVHLCFCSRPCLPSVGVAAPVADRKVNSGKGGIAPASFFFIIAKVLPCRAGRAGGASYRRGGSLF